MNQKKIVLAFFCVIATLLLMVCSSPANEVGEENNKNNGGTKGNDNFTNFNIEMELILSGTFVMGSPISETPRKLEETQHTVTLTRDFYIGKYEVTQKLWNAVMGDNRSHPDNTTATLPVNSPSWFEAIAFCNKLSLLEGKEPVYFMPQYSNSSNPADWGTPCADGQCDHGSEHTVSKWNDVKMNIDAKGYRLPTEAEWEYACRANTATAYNWGDSITPGNANYGSTIGNPIIGGDYGANSWKLFDMHGNVAEWCWDWHDAGYYQSADAAKPNPTGPVTGTGRLVRGGSCFSNGDDLRSAFRSYSKVPKDWSTDVGLRLVRTK